MAVVLRFALFPLLEVSFLIYYSDLRVSPDLAFLELFCVGLSLLSDPSTASLLLFVLLAGKHERFCSLPAL